jgi:hypothetical protein
LRGRQCARWSSSQAQAPSTGTEVCTFMARSAAALSVTGPSKVTAIGMATP